MGRGVAPEFSGHNLDHLVRVVSGKLRRTPVYIRGTPVYIRGSPEYIRRTPDIIRRTPETSGKFRNFPSGKFRKLPETSGELRKPPENSGYLRGTPETSGNLRKVPVWDRQKVEQSLTGELRKTPVYIRVMSGLGPGWERPERGARGQGLGRAWGTPTHWV